MTADCWALSCRRLRRLCFATVGPLALYATVPTSLTAQSGAVPRGATSAAPVAQPAVGATSSAMHSVDGRVRRPVSAGGDSTGMGPVAGAWVTLHRVGKDSAGPIDSIRTDRAGRYRMQWRPSGAVDAVYFASVTWGGIAYFTPPLRETEARGDAAEITVFDTTTRTFPLAVKGRHLIVGMLDSAEMRTVIEVFELSNDSARTLVTVEGASPAPTWSLAIPKAAQDVRVTEGEISPESFAYNDGRVSIFAPIAPGLKQLAFSYKLPANSFPITVRAENGAVVFEVLLEDAQGTVFGEGFAAVDPVTLENRNFRRFLAQDFKPRGEVTVEVPLARSPGRKLY
ncbi:MAG: hypothetical protein IT353_23950, partial [Gemmatimonadaceae bacterium]|nr:hypothetical protein [Gemmatimonadaceae bacterium]